MPNYTSYGAEIDDDNGIFVLQSDTDANGQPYYKLGLKYLYIYTYSTIFGWVIGSTLNGSTADYVNNNPYRSFAEAIAGTPAYGYENITLFDGLTLIGPSPSPTVTDLIIAVPTLDAAPLLTGTPAIIPTIQLSGY